ncbi:tetratricopeptide repeat protein [Pseudoalteromonas byunsanensis]|uniref:Uncharacterized protein n=1 Tax=Pseudoalteromonas byunsanensis TaxID=327939 RepID=A0A1S1NCX9_9GAMM|nr:tetratricopeptide repeat protein [Pseudoalteromonas byunsanensis]OHU97325.1 hypothetical protein BIW53_03110 [Pseudoalteromonas byunsanensis]
MSISRTEKLITFWRTDNTNEALLGDLLASISQQREFERYTQIYPEIPFSQINASTIHAQAVELLLGSGQFELAKKHLHNYQALLGEWYAYFDALINFTESNYAQCIDIFKRLEAESALPPMSYPLFARAYYISGQIEQAQQVLEKYLPEQANAEALGLYAMCCLDLDDKDKAEHFANLALQQSQTQLDALLALASCELAKHEIANAEYFVEKCLEINPMIGRTWSLAGQINLYNAQYTAAVETLSKAVTLMPDHIGTYHLLAWAYLILNDVDKAAEQFEQALELNPNFADSHAGLAIIAINRGQFDVAKTLTKKALRLDAHSFTALYAQSLLAAQDGDEDAASKMIEQILSSQSNVDKQTYKQLIEKAVFTINERSGKGNEH